MNRMAHFTCMFFLFLNDIVQIYDIDVEMNSFFSIQIIDMLPL